MNISRFNIQNSNYTKFKSNLKEQKSSKTVEKHSTVKKHVLICAGALVTAGMGFAIYNKSFIKTKHLTAAQKDFFKLCKNSKLENYKSSAQNINSGIFNIDLHSHSNYSDGYASVPNLLEQAVSYANKVFAKTGKKFTFALTDHDRVGGVREALKIIKSNPEKYKNLNFIPAVELSFSFISNGKIKAGELLAYFINPDSKEIKILVENLNKNRYEMIDNAINKLGKGFSRSEMENYFINKDGETFAYNLHYRIRNYAQIKNRINKMAKESNENPDLLYRKIMQNYVFSYKRVPKPYVSPEGLENYLKQNNIKTKTEIYDKKIDEICEEFFPKIVDGKIVSNTENSFEKIIETFKNDENVVLAFAHPYFTAQEMANYKKEFDSLIKLSNGKIKMAEIYHQSYPQNIPINKINEINQYLLKKNLIPLGGRDNHSSNLI